LISACTFASNASAQVSGSLPSFLAKLLRGWRRLPVSSSMTSQRTCQRGVFDDIRRDGRPVSKRGPGFDPAGVVVPLGG